MCLQPTLTYQQPEMLHSMVSENEMPQKPVDRLEADGTGVITVQDSMPSEHEFSIFSARQKKAIAVAGSFAAFFSPVSSNIYFPALVTVAKDLRVSLSQINLTVTTYQVIMTFLFTTQSNLTSYQHLVMCYISNDIYLRSCKGSHQCS